MSARSGHIENKTAVIILCLAESSFCRLAPMLRQPRFGVGARATGTPAFPGRCFMEHMSELPRGQLNQTTIEGQGTIGVGESITNRATNSATGTLTLEPTSGTITNTGTLEATNGATLEVVYTTLQYRQHDSGSCGHRDLHGLHPHRRHVGHFGWRRVGDERPAGRRDPVLDKSHPGRQLSRSRQLQSRRYRDQHRFDYHEFGVALR